MLWVAGGFVLVLVGMWVMASLALRPGPAPAGAVVQRMISKDGTAIEYERSGQGPALVLVSAALADRMGTRKLATALSPQFTVINYDRRGRGGSGATPPYAVEREVEDVEALIGAAGGHASLFGSSSGAVLALEAAARLGVRVDRVFLYEPPFIVDGSHAPMEPGLGREIAALVEGGRRDDAVERFFAKGMGLPGPAARMMRWFMPGWSSMTKIAHTAPYDLAVLAGTQTGQALPAERWVGVKARVLVAVGSRSEPFFHSGARALAALLPGVEYRALEGRDHSAVLMAAPSLAAEMAGFLQSSR